MKIVKQTPTELTIKLGSKTALLAFGVIILVAGVLAVSVFRIQPLSQENPMWLDFFQQQTQDDELEPDFENPSTGDVGYRLARHFRRTLFTRERSFFLLGLVAIVLGLFIVVSPAGHSQTVTFDKSQRKLILKQPGWFFRSQTETYPFQNITEVRVERDRSVDRTAKRGYRVNLVISHSEGIPLTPNYIQYVEVFPLSRSYKYSQKEAQEFVDHIHTFLEETNEQTS